MHPILARFTIGGAEVVLRAYPVFYVLAGVVAIALATVVASRRGIRWTRALLVFGLSLAIGVVGARLLDLGVNWGYYAEDTSRIYSLGLSRLLALRRADPRAGGRRRFSPGSSRPTCGASPTARCRRSWRASR